MGLLNMQHAALPAIRVTQTKAFFINCFCNFEHILNDDLLVESKTVNILSPSRYTSEYFFLTKTHVKKMNIQM